MEWTRILAYITGIVDQELLLRNEYLAAENRILRAQLNGCLRLSDAERATLGEIGFRLGRKALREVATVAQPVAPQNVSRTPRDLENVVSNMGCGGWPGVAIRCANGTSRIRAICRGRGTMSSS
jgi:hypothetical protein